MKSDVTSSNKWEEQNSSTAVRIAVMVILAVAITLNGITVYAAGKYEADLFEFKKSKITRKIEAAGSREFRDFKHLPPQNLTASTTFSSLGTYRVELKWMDLSEAEMYVIERRSITLQAPWEIVGYRGNSEQSHIDTLQPSDEVYEYRLAAQRGTVMSAYSNTVPVALEQK